MLREIGRADCKWCMPDNSMDPPKWCRDWEGCKRKLPNEKLEKDIEEIDVKL